MTDLLARLNAGEIIILDGATGTQLQGMGLPAGMAPELWNLQNPEAVKRHYQLYVDAGSDAILTNSFGGTRPRLDMESSGHLTHEINVAAAALAREVAGDQVIVMGCMGPTGLLVEPMGELTYDTSLEYFAEQAAALVEGGADSIHIETLSDLTEVRGAIDGARKVTDLPITITMSFDMHGRTMMGVTPAQAAQEIWAHGVTAVGVNCGRALGDNLESLIAMRTAVPEARLMAKPNAGLPQTTDGIEVVYHVTPEILAEYSHKFARQHVSILGGCCGTTPEHIKVMKAALQGYTPPPIDQVVAENKAQMGVAPTSPAKNSRQRRSRRKTR